MSILGKSLILIAATGLLAVPIALAATSDDILAAANTFRTTARSNTENFVNQTCTGAPPCTSGHAATARTNADTFVDNTGDNLSPDFTTLAAQRDDIANTGSPTSFVSQANTAVLGTAGAGVTAGSTSVGAVTTAVGVVAPAANGFAQTTVSLAGTAGFSQRKTGWDTGNSTFNTVTGFALGEAGELRTIASCSAFGGLTCTQGAGGGDLCTAEAAASRLASGTGPASCTAALKTDPTAATATPTAAPVGPANAAGAVHQTPVRLH